MADIYAEGISTGHATFATEVPAWAAWDDAHLADHRLVAVDLGHTVHGWAALSPVSDRCAYSGVAEVSVYTASASQGRGVGLSLLTALIVGSEDAGIWTVQSGILAENKASLALHHKAGFRTVGRRERLGQLNGEWRDVLLLERRSSVVNG